VQLVLGAAEEQVIDPGLPHTELGDDRRGVVEGIRLEQAEEGIEQGPGQEGDQEPPGLVEREMAVAHLAAVELPGDQEQREHEEEFGARQLGNDAQDRRADALAGRGGGERLSGAVGRAVDEHHAQRGINTAGVDPVEPLGSAVRQMGRLKTRHGAPGK
jgi:hypothetical protein